MPRSASTAIVDAPEPNGHPGGEVNDTKVTGHSFVPKTYQSKKWIICTSVSHKSAFSGNSWWHPIKESLQAVEQLKDTDA